MKLFSSFLSIIFILSACRNDEKLNAAADTSKNPPSIKVEKIQSEKPLKDQSASKKDLTKIEKQSFVISCGSGCAMTYNVKEINPINKSSIKVMFTVDMYVDEKISETFDEAYTFIYNNSNAIKGIIRDGENGNVLNEMMESAQLSFKKFGEELIKEIR